MSCTAASMHVFSLKLVLLHAADCKQQFSCGESAYNQCAFPDVEGDFCGGPGTDLPAIESHRVKPYSLVGGLCACFTQQSFQCYPQLVLLNQDHAWGTLPFLAMPQSQAPELLQACCINELAILIPQAVFVGPNKAKSTKHSGHLCPPQHVTRNTWHDHF